VHDDVSGIYQVHAHAAVARRNDGGVIEIRLYGIDRLLVGIDRSDDLIRPDLQLGRPAAGCQKPSRQVRDRWSLSSRKQVGHRLSSFGPSPAHRRHSDPCQNGTPVPVPISQTTSTQLINGGGASTVNYICAIITNGSDAENLSLIEGTAGDVWLQHGRFGGRHDGRRNGRGRHRVPGLALQSGLTQRPFDPSTR
jgi:hypothetical protein